MSDYEAISSSKLLYSRDFLLRYSSIQNPDSTIAEKLDVIDSTPAALGSSCGTLPKRTNTKNPVDSITAINAISRAAKTPNHSRKNGLSLYSQKENTLNLSHPVLSKQPGAESYTTPLRKGPLGSRTARPLMSNKSPVTRKTWVAAVESNRLPLVSSQEALELVSDSLLMPDPMSFTTPISSPNPKTPISKSLPYEANSPTSSNTQTEGSYLSPKSASATPFNCASSPRGLRYTPSKSPRSPIRPISPLDEQRLAQRQKQIDYGYRTVGYLRYRLLVAKDHRKPDHPRTPKKTQGCSKRSWDGQLKKWRRDLHLWDPDNVDAFKALLNSDLVVSIIAANPELAEIVDIVKEKLDNPTLDFEDDLGEDSDYLSNSLPSLYHSVPALPVSVFSGFSDEKKGSPRRHHGDAAGDTKLHKVSRELVF